MKRVALPTLLLFAGMVYENVVLLALAPATQRPSACSMFQAFSRARSCMPACEHSAMRPKARRMAHSVGLRSVHSAGHCVFVWLRGAGEADKREGAMWIKFARKIGYMFCNRCLGDPRDHTLRSPLMSMRIWIELEDLQWTFLLKTFL